MSRDTLPDATAVLKTAINDAEFSLSIHREKRVVCFEVAQDGTVVIWRQLQKRLTSTWSDQI